MKNNTALLLTFTFALLLTAGCTRIETGEVGLRINFDKTTDPTERLPGSFNQTLMRAITPADVVVASANELVRAQNELNVSPR